MIGGINVIERSQLPLRELILFSEYFKKTPVSYEYADYINEVII